ncbi:DUF2017 domain-containing protein [Corynebacterium sp. sy017]|uniref:DUF2017 domain-containing protein n=1 Tax=unclassified Corynebacterium TaxID=2624378 RepID=UPI001186CB6F|nr:MULTISPECIES: DUF2017 domain-containing protein [unclassified Corynebacterium]MBP3088173.1 DUF2017 domain-containing protein [Corynebacterium sp. sy017]QDZ43104.1 DUF2017 domain-containing protein [Corynebacterium sp. sy039]TSD92678.1 DUF2017 domain-containing protein [Corynebacterium sp. SY003]
MQDWKKKRSLVRGAKYSCVLEPMEREVLGELAATVSEALIARAQSAPQDELAELTGIISGHKEAPSDPGLARLLPDFERDCDEEYEGDNALLRSLHEHDITRAKLEHLRVIVDALGPDGGVHINISEEEAHAWLAGLNDIRLFLSASEVPTQELMQREQIVEWLAYNQDSLLTAMMGDMP